MSNDLLDPRNADYLEFLRRKDRGAPRRGLKSVPPLASHLQRFQADCAAFSLEVGSAGDYLATGLGKTAIGLEYARLAAAASNGRALVLTPLAVARQWEREGLRWGYQIRVIREQSHAGEGLNVCNYDRLEKLEPEAFGAVVFDESSVAKAYTGKVSRAMIKSFAGHRWRLALSATPAPNDHMELGQQSELLGIMPSNEMLMRWFVSDQTEMGRYRLKGHAVTAFWDWMASWSRMAEHPRDLGDDVAGYDLPALNVVRHRVDGAEAVSFGEMFAGDAISATTMHDIKRQTARARAELAAEIVGREPAEPWVIWVDTDYEADSVGQVLPAAIDMRGSHSIERKEEALQMFAEGGATRLVTKPSICGWGLNWQHCARMLFVGRSFSYELWHQAVRRCWRFGQRRPVDVHLIVADGEDAIGRVIDRKANDHARMRVAMVAAMARAMGRSDAVRKPYDPQHLGRLPAWLM